MRRQSKNFLDGVEEWQIDRVVEILYGVKTKKGKAKDGEKKESEVNEVEGQDEGA